MDFSNKHDINNTHDTVAKVIAKFKKAGSVTDNREVVIDGNQVMKEQPTWGWLRLQGVSKNKRSLGSESEVSRVSILGKFRKHESPRGTQFHAQHQIH